MANLPQLIDPAGYRPCDWDLAACPAGLAYWLGVFRWHLDEVLVPLIRAEYDPTLAGLEAFRADYLAAYAAVERDPRRFPRVDVLLFTEIREQMHARHGFADPFRGLKQRENEAALALLPGVLAEIDAAEPQARTALLAAGLMAGNIFDLGSRSTIELHRNGLTAFAASRAALPARPWLVDDLDPYARRCGARPSWRHAVFFVDNCGSDIVLGCLPFARELCRAGTPVTLAANTGPALNDITAAELVPLLGRAAESDPVIAAAWDSRSASAQTGRLRVAATGSHTPLIDLAALAPDLAAAAADADLLILHGMGRAIESNFHARFTCDVLHTAVLKDAAVAARIGGRVFDCVFRYLAK
ncbi:MAG: ARMT1-like domain-containing protein [Planctomycetota bacterium]